MIKLIAYKTAETADASKRGLIKPAYDEVCVETARDLLKRHVDFVGG